MLASFDYMIMLDLFLHSGFKRASSFNTPQAREIYYGQTGLHQNPS